MTDHEYLIDTRFYYNKDNPFHDDPTFEKKRKLKKFISMNPDAFTEVDYLIDNRFLIMFPETEELFGKPVEDSDITKTEFTNVLKTIILGCDCISDEVREWASHQEVIPMNINISGSSLVSSVTKEGKITPVKNENMQLNLAKILQNGTIYDIYSERTITYDELQKITRNIARSLIDPKGKANEAIIAIENEERRKLINAIQEFKNVTVISPYIEDDIGKLTVEQLKTLKEKCEKIHSQFKVGEALKSGFTVCSIAYDTLFPEGIPVSKTKRLQFGGIGEEIKNKLLDNTKTVGFSFSRFLQKHNINITDELTFMIAMGEILTSKAKIISVKAKDKKSDKKSDDKADSNDSSSDSSSSDSGDSDSNDSSSDESDSGDSDSNDSSDESDSGDLDKPPKLRDV